MNDSDADAKGIFLGALESAPADLAGYLDQACAGNAALRARVEELMRARREAGKFLGGDWSPATEAHVPLVEVPGTVVGPYKLLEQIGEGGFGVVFMAEQEHPVRRRVAVKIIKLGMDSKQVTARFDAERQALALMDHPNIAKVLDAGTSDSGRPYFVMELVKGVPITEYCDSQHLSVPQRLELMVAVCQAVQHAHQKGIIHRDLKPSNVLVAEYDGRPVPRIIDFGVAKAIGQRLTERTLFTQFGQIVGTLEYMSPEQARFNQLDVDTRSDVFSLGVLLYELLAGSTPLEKERLQSAAFDEILRLIGEEQPQRPSLRLGSSQSLPSIAANRHVEPGRLSRLVSGELDWIAMRCLEKDRNRRYETPLGLAQDLQRYLADEAVDAGPPSASYRLRKFVARNKLPVIATVAVLAALVAGVIGTTIGMIGQSRQRAIAEEQRSEAVAAKDQLEAVNKFLTEDVLGAADPVRLPDKAVRDQFIKAVINPAAATVAERFKDKPLVEAAVRHAVSAAYENVGRSDLALPHAKRELEIRRQKLGDKHPDTLKSADWVGTLLRSLGQLDQAEPQLRETLSTRRTLLGNDDEDTISSIMSLSILLQTQGKLSEAEQLCREAVDHSRTALPKDSQTTIEALNNLGYVLQAEGKVAEAEPLMRDALDRVRRLKGDSHPDTQYALNNMGTLMTAEHKYDEAERYLREAIEHLKGDGGDAQPVLRAMVIFNMANLLQAESKFDQAESMYREALERRERVLGPNHPDTLLAADNFGGMYMEWGQPEKAEPLFRKTVPGVEIAFGKDHVNVANERVSLGAALVKLNRYPDAENELSAAELILGAAQTVPPKIRERLCQKFVELYDAWDKAEPGKGYDAKAQPWRAKLPDKGPPTTQSAAKMGRR